MIEQHDFIEVLKPGVKKLLHSMLDEVIDKVFEEKQWNKRLYMLFIASKEPEFKVEISLL